MPGSVKEQTWLNVSRSANNQSSVRSTRWPKQHRPQVPAQVAALSLVLNATLSLVLVPQLGMTGAALAASLSYSVAVAVLALRFARHAGLPLAAVLIPGLQLRSDLALLLASLLALFRALLRARRQRGGR